MAVEQIYLSAEAEERGSVLRTGSNGPCARRLQIHIEQNPAESGNDAVPSADGALPRAAEMRGRVLRGGFLFSRPCVPCRPKMEDRFLAWPDLQVLVSRDAEIPHFGQLAGLDVGVSVRVFVQAQKLLDLQNADRVVAIDMCQP